MTKTLNNYNFRVPSPDGPATIFITESPDGPFIQIFIGKAGTSVAAWSDALAAMTTFALRSTSLDEVINALADITTDRIAYRGDTSSRSGPEALVIALRTYREILRETENGEQVA
jgi:hypothetical protein